MDSREMEKAHEKMAIYLHDHVKEGALKDKLHDQLIWLKYQIHYYSKGSDQETLQENFEWVLDNFKHDLHSDFDWIIKK